STSTLTSTPTPATSTLSLHDALPISRLQRQQIKIGSSVQRHRQDLRRFNCRSRRRAYSLYLHRVGFHRYDLLRGAGTDCKHGDRSEEHTSELQSRGHLVCRLLLEKKK